jgi:pimeloyl-ACP methyl ester carboxylesterase
VERAGAPPLIVKDWGRRSRLVRCWLAPRLVAHELAALERLEGLPGVPRPAGRVGPHALAMEYLAGLPLQRHRSQPLSAAFFDALEGIIEGIAARGLVHLDLRSPTNVLYTSSGAPGIVDLGGAFPLPLPAALRRALHRSAIAKLRARFPADDGARNAVAAAQPGRDLKAGGVRFRLADEGVLGDPVPALLLHDVGLSAAMFARELAGARAAGRRVLAPGLPPFGGSGRPPRGSAPRAQARRLLALLDALRIGRVDLAGWGFGAVVAGALAQLAPDRVREASTLGGLAALRSACAEARAGREVRLPLSLPEGLDAATLEVLRVAQVTAPRDAVARALRAIDARAFELAPREPTGV